ncbi:MAG: dephospho-CoA kinase [Candidatus Omnitrophica bacterium]|nr:dephospho-CoA kinase [Candidatus Omnitrophota bacterium]
MITIGLTGNLGTGKSTVAKMFAQCGAVVIDADVIVHGLFKSNPKVINDVVRRFGKEIVSDKVVDRRKLAEIVFRDETKLKQLTSIVHPIALKEVQGQIQRLRKNPQNRMVVIDAPLLIEAGWHKWVDYLIVVKSSRQLQEERLIKERAMSRAEIARRLKAQLPIQQKINMADIVIDNRSSLNNTQQQTNMIVQKLMDRAKSS